MLCFNIFLTIREEIDSLYVPIFDQIIELIEGQRESVRVRHDAEIKVTKMCIVPNFRQSLWLEALDLMTTSISLLKIGFAVSTRK